MVRDSRDDWEANGSLNMYDHSIAKAKEILAETPKEIVPLAVRQEINALITECEVDWKD